MKNIISVVVATFVVGTVVLGGACGMSQQTSETLDESVRVYNDSVRWQRYEAAASRLPAKQRSEFLDEMDQRAKDVKITDYDVVRVDAKGAREARVQIKVSWYRDSEGTLRETHAVQTWERQGKTWVMVEETRIRGDEMPGLREPVAIEPPKSAEATPIAPDR